MIVKRLAECGVNIHPVKPVVNGRSQQIDRRFALAREIAEQLRMPHFMKFRLPKTIAGAQKPVVFIAVFSFRRVVCVVYLGVSNAVATEHDVHINLQIEHRVAPNRRVTEQF